MKGMMLTFLPYRKAVVRELTREPPLQEIKRDLDGGWLELVPGFTSIEHEGEQLACVAFCDEDGKRKELEINNWATLLWDHALRKTGHPGLITPAGTVADYLVGPVVVLAGDPEFMQSLKEDEDV